MRPRETTSAVAKQDNDGQYVTAEGRMMMDSMLLLRESRMMVDSMLLPRERKGGKEEEDVCSCTERKVEISTSSKK